MAERERISAELARLSVVDKPVRDGEAAVAAIDREVADLDASERATWLAWAAAPDGEAPALKTAERRAFAQRRAEVGGRSRRCPRRRCCCSAAPLGVEHRTHADRPRNVSREGLRNASIEGIRLNGEAHEIIEQIGTRFRAFLRFVPRCLRRRRQGECRRETLETRAHTRRREDRQSAVAERQLRRRNAQQACR